MADSSGSTRVPLWVTFADGLVVALAVLACVVMLGGGVRTTLGSVFISVTSPIRPLVLAALIAVIRHVVFRGPTLWERLQSLLAGLVRRGGSDPLLAVADPLTASEIALVTALLLVLTAVMTYPQIRQLDAVGDLGDPLFSIWRLKWIAHQLPHDPLHLFDGNIFYPTRNTLALSDSILLPGLMAAPFLWVGASAVPLYNLYLLLTFVLAGVAMYALVRVLTGQVPAALVAAVIFAFYPFRFEHYSHFELQFSFWMPLALLALHRTLALGRLRDGSLLGAVVGAQTLSSLYFGVFLATYLVPVWGVIALARGRVAKSIKPLLAGVAVAVVLTAPLASPYLQVRQAQGERGYDEMAYYSAKPSSYLVPHSSRTTYVNVLRQGDHGPERDLFPGTLVMILALVAVWPPLSPTRLAYTLGLVLAFEASLGMHGFLYPVLAKHVLPFRGLRVPARFSMLVGLSLAILAGYGTARIAARLRRPRFRYLLAAGLAAIVLFESRATLPLEHVPEPHAVYQWFNARPPAVIAELPVPEPTMNILWTDVRSLYPATFHWQRMLNGNSGTYPPSYIAFCAAMQTFPDDRSIRLLEQRGVDYVIVHEEYYGRAQYESVTNALEQRHELQQVVRVRDRGWEARLYRLAK